MIENKHLWWEWFLQCAKGKHTSNNADLRCSNFVFLANMHNIMNSPMSPILALLRFSDFAWKSCTLFSKYSDREGIIVRNAIVSLSKCTYAVMAASLSCMVPINIATTHLFNKQVKTSMANELKLLHRTTRKKSVCIPSK
jgi:hypothetical protein